MREVSSQKVKITEFLEISVKVLGFLVTVGDITYLGLGLKHSIANLLGLISLKNATKSL